MILEAISNQDWDVVDRLLSSPEVCQVRDEQGRLPLHNMFSYKRAPCQLVLKLIQVYPKAVSEEDDDKLLPIHHACFWGTSPKIIEILIKTYPEGLDHPNAFGDTPRNLCEIGCLNAHSKSLIRKPTTYWIELNKFDMRTNHLKDFVTTGIMSSAKILRDTLVEEMRESVIVTRADSNLSLNSFKGIKSKVGLMFSNNNTFEERLNKLEQSNQDTCMQLQQAQKDNESCHQKNALLEKKLIQVELQLQQKQQKLKEFEEQNVDYQKQAQGMMDTQLDTTRKMESKVDSFVFLEYQEFIEDQLSIVDHNLTQDLQQLKHVQQESQQDLKKSLATQKSLRTSSGELQNNLSHLQETMTVFQQEYRNGRIMQRVENLELAFQNALKGIDTTNKVKQEFEIKLEEIKQACMRNGASCQTQQQALEKQSKSMNNLSQDMDLVKNEQQASQEKSKQTAKNVTEKMHDSKQILKSILDSQKELQTEINVTKQSFDEKLAIVTNITSSKLDVQLQKHMKEMQLPLEKLQQDLIVLDVEWNARHSLLEKEVASSMNRAFDGEDWEST